MDSLKEPHSISLKVLRLSRPSLAEQHPLPPQAVATISPRAALGLPEGSIDDKFLLTPLLTLPPAFGSAYVGEAFSCTLCVNNELHPTADRLVASVKISADMQTPNGNKLELDLNPPTDDASKSGMSPGDTLQKIVRFDLRDEGMHELGISLSYTESIISKEDRGIVSGGRVRTFKKIYRFNALPCLSVRTKATDLPAEETDSKEEEESKIARYALEAQLENLADGLITLESLTFEAKAPFQSKSLNWDIAPPGIVGLQPPTLAPHEVTQVAFLIEEQQTKGEDVIEKQQLDDGRTILGVLSIRWRSVMGEPGVLSTGWLTSRRR